MVKQVKCPGCKKKYDPGRSYTQHTNSCKGLDSATDKILKKHKIAIAKKAEEKKIKIAQRKELKLAAQELPTEPGPIELANDPQNMDDIDMEIVSVCSPKK